MTAPTNAVQAAAGLTVLYPDPVNGTTSTVLVDKIIALTVELRVLNEMFLAYFGVASGGPAAVAALGTLDAQRSANLAHIIPPGSLQGNTYP